jgi:hypothetical protein
MKSPGKNPGFLFIEKPPAIFCLLETPAFCPVVVTGVPTVCLQFMTVINPVPAVPVHFKTVVVCIPVITASDIMVRFMFFQVDPRIIPVYRFPVLADFMAVVIVSISMIVITLCLCGNSKE